MRSRLLPPEAHIELQISLDQLRKAEDECRVALARLVEGQLSKDDYSSLAQRQKEAQYQWESRQRKYFGALMVGDPVG